MRASLEGRESAQHAERRRPRSMTWSKPAPERRGRAYGTGTSGQNSGITAVATSQSRMFSGMPTFMKSPKR